MFDSSLFLSISQLTSVVDCRYGAGGANPLDSSARRERGWWQSSVPTDHRPSHIRWMLGEWQLQLGVRIGVTVARRGEEGGMGARGCLFD